MAPCLSCDSPNAAKPPHLSHCIRSGLSHRIKLRLMWTPGFARDLLPQASAVPFPPIGTDEEAACLIEPFLDGTFAAEDQADALPTVTRPAAGSLSILTPPPHIAIEKKVAPEGDQYGDSLLIGSPC